MIRMRSIFVPSLLFAALAASVARAEDGTTANGAPGIGGSLIPHDLSPWHMFLNADVVVKTVLVGLALASVITWTVWLAKSIELLRAKHSAEKALDAVEAARTLDVENDGFSGAAGALLAAARSELSLSGNPGAALQQAGLLERVGSRLQRVEAAAARRMTRGTGILATIGSVGPFVGLFGTVWGIMNSFIGISQSQTTNLAVVAPGIAEALLATAVGLVAAIPAVVIYNVFARAISGYRALLTDISAALVRAISREIDRPAAATSGLHRLAAE